MDEILRTTFFSLIAFITIILILAKPYLGVVFTLVSLPVVDLLPPISFLTSIVIFIGIVTLAGFLFQKLRSSKKSIFNFGSIHIIGLLFVVWILVSNFQAAWSGENRNWLLTFLQLWALVWLTGELFDSPEKQHVFMWLFSVVSVVAAIISIRQGNIGDTISTSTRAIGLAGNPNSTGRYLVVAMVFFSYLGTITNKRLLRLLAIGGVIVTFLGVFYTLSRTSILLLVAAIVLQNIFNARRKFSYTSVAVYLIAALVMWFLASQIVNILQSIVPSILQGTDTVGVRYKLWQAAWNMWLDHIFQGVGIGMYPSYLRYYALGLAPHYWAEPPHNTYLTALAETGLVGFILFALLPVLSLKNFLQSGKIDDTTINSLRNVWLTVFVVVLLGEITANGLYDKLLWFLFGISVYFRRQFSMRQQEIVEHEQVQHGSMPVLERR